MRSRIVLLATLLAALGAGPALAQEPPRAPAPTPAPAPPYAVRPPVTFGFLLHAGPPLSVMEVLPGSAAEAGGIRPGDIVVSVDGRAATIAAVQSAAHRASPGDTVRFRIRRDDREWEMAVVPRARRFAYAPEPRGTRERERRRERHRERIVVIDPDSIRALTRLYLEGAREALEHYGELDLNLDLGDLDLDRTQMFRFQFDSLGPEIRKQLLEIGPQIRELSQLHFEGPNVEVDFDNIGSLPGATITDLDPDLARYFPGAEDGVLVLSVRPESRADEAGLEAGDVIVEFDGEAVGTVSDLWGVFGPGGEEHVLEVVRRGERLTLRLPS